MLYSGKSSTPVFNQVFASAEVEEEAISCVVEVETNHCLKQPPCLAHLARMGTADRAAGQVLSGVWSRDLLALHQDGDLTSSEVTDTPRSKRESYWQRPDGQVLLPLAGAEMNASWILHLS